MKALLQRNFNISIEVFFITGIDDKIQGLKECEKCRDIQIKKFTPLKDNIDLNKLNKDYMRCECGKRPLDVVMSHILKIMMETGIAGENASLRHNSPVPLMNFYYSNLNPQFIAENTLILLHPDFNDDAAQRLTAEVPEVACILKGNPQIINGIYDKNSKTNHFKKLLGDDTQINVMRTILGEKIILTKKQSIHHIEVATTTEEKLIKLHNYLDNNNIKKGIALDGMCGLGALGIYLSKYGFKKVIFNDINPEMTDALRHNLKLNNITNFEIKNEAFEDLKIDKVEFCVIDSFPGADITEIIKKAEKIADNVLII